MPKRRTTKQQGGNFFKVNTPWPTHIGPHHVISHGAGAQVGGSFLGDVWTGIKSAGKFIKDNKLVSRGLSFIPGVGAQAGSQVASQLGWGKKRKVGRVRAGAVRF
jgi:hypothetical protein